MSFLPYSLPSFKGFRKNTTSMLLAFMLSFSLIPAEAKKMNYPLEVMIGLADLIVTGEIVNTSADGYTFKIDQTLRGFSNKQIRVNMFEEWICDTRMKKAEAGQKLFLFLTGNGISAYNIINGSTGEIFILNKKVSGFTGYFKPHNLDGVIIAIKNFLSCYLFTGKEYAPFRRNVFIQIKKGPEVLVLENVNLFSIWLFGNMKYYTISRKSS